MAVIKPFKGIRYNLEKFSSMDPIVSPPYDVIDSDRQKELFDRSEHGMVRLDLGMVYDTDTETDNRYTRAAELFAKWTDGEVLVQDNEPAIYCIEEDYPGEFGDVMTRCGYISAVKVESQESGVYKPHERTLAGPKADRLNLTKACRANFSPVFSLYDDPDLYVETLLQEAKNASDPIFSTTADNGVVTRVWKITAGEVCTKVADFMADKSFFIADGHHRYETAMNYQSFRAQQATEVTGDEEWNYVMMYLSNMWSPGLSILPTHRAVHGLGEFALDDFLAKAAEWFTHEALGSVDEVLDKMSSNRDGRHSFGYVADSGERFGLLTLKPGVDVEAASGQTLVDALKGLDVTVLHSLILETILKIDKKAQENQTNLKYVKETAALVDRVVSGQSQIGFYMNPTLMSQVKEVAESGSRMPQKSTFFFPKVLTGLVINPLG